ncbi:hypothetical protein MLD38_036567 [Melastoma candidum]|uniref:Uncharacterized protein n=1 Tax=Melastoma candidum TaxID=119954 RepID=A0ACB9LKH7_9MYRT|nr:hypothetical protein MLD38_036567 [Melastoma candidum]
MAILTASSAPSPSTPSPLFPEKPRTASFPRSSVNVPRLKGTRSPFPVARLFGPSTFKSSKLKVMFVGVDDAKHPGKLPRTYTLTHCDITSNLNLAISQTINNSQLQGWYNKLQRDEVVAMWKKVKGEMSLHVHCHISGGHFLLDLCARLRTYIFSNELPVVLRAFIHGDGNLLDRFPELKQALVWVHFHSNIDEFDRVECWGPLKDAGSHKPESRVNHLHVKGDSSSGSTLTLPEPCQGDCKCCFSPGWSRSDGWGNPAEASWGLGPKLGLGR